MSTNGKKPREGGGGLGGLSSIHAKGSRDTRLIRKAIKQRWPINDEDRQALIERQVRIAKDPKASNREATSAFKSILSAESQNQADEHKALPDLKLNADIKLKGAPADVLKKAVQIAEELEKLSGDDFLEG